MGYLHIENLYRPITQDILLWKRLYALEKVHGSSANITWLNGQVALDPGGMSQVRFDALFDIEALKAKFATLMVGRPPEDEAVIFGEVYGGSCQKMSHVYGDLAFIAFDVRIAGIWLNVPNAVEVVESFGLEFVPYKEIPAEIEAVNAERDAPSVVAERRGMGKHSREGIVLRPLVEVRLNNDQRMIAKHKTDDFAERKSPPKVGDPAKLKVLAEAEAIADEWVTEHRLDHILQKLPQGIGMEAVPKVIAAMVEDVLREASGEIVDSKDARSAIGKRAVKLFKERLQKVLV